MTTLLVQVRYGETVVAAHMCEQGVQFDIDEEKAARVAGFPLRCVYFEGDGVRLTRVKGGTAFVTPQRWLDITKEGLIPVYVDMCLDEGSGDHHHWLHEGESSCGTEEEQEEEDIPHVRFEDTAMQARFDFLTKRVYPATCLTQEDMKNFRRECKRSYCISVEGDLMFMGNMKRPQRMKKHECRAYTAQFSGMRKVIPTRAAMLAIVNEWHKHVHDGGQRVEEGLNALFFYHDIASVIKENRSSCARCSEFEKVPKTTQAIISSRKFEIVMIDIFFLPMPAGVDGDVCVLLMKDHFTKYHWAKSFKGKDMGPIAKYILEIFSDGEVPERIHCDNGSEFVNMCMKEVLRLLNIRSFSHGKPRHPQTQGLIERANRTVKQKIIKMCMDRGYTTAGQVFDWVTEILPAVIRAENDAPIHLYANMTAHIAFFGVPRFGGGIVRPDPLALARVHLKMHECQLARAYKRNQFPVFEDIQVGSIVNVLASKKDIKNGYAIANWSSRAIVHRVSALSADAFYVRWLSNGLHAKQTNAGRKVAAAPGTLSPAYLRGHLRLVAGEEPAVVYHTEYGGTALVTHTFADGTCNYVLLDGEWMGSEYSDDVATLSAMPSQTYASYALRGANAGDENEADDEKLAEEARAKRAAKRKRKAMEDIEEVPFDEEQVQDVKAWLDSDHPNKTSSIPRNVKKRGKKGRKTRRKAVETERRAKTKRRRQVRSRVDKEAAPRNKVKQAKRRRGSEAPVAEEQAADPSGVAEKTDEDGNDDECGYLTPGEIEQELQEQEVCKHTKRSILFNIFFMISKHTKSSILFNIFFMVRKHTKISILFNIFFM